MNNILQGDCLELMKGITDKSIDLILCDLPYGTTANTWDVIIPFEPLWEQYKRIIKDNGAIVLTASEPFASHLRLSNEKMYKYDWVWNKKKSGNIFIAKYQPLKIHELVLVFGKGKTNYFPQMREGKERNKILKIRSKDYEQYERKQETIVLEEKTNLYNPISIVEFSLAGLRKKSMHPTQKPVELFEYLIRTYTKEGDVVLDNCSGSGTTGIACLNTGRSFILMEQDPYYFNMCKERIANHLSVKTAE
jgi:site-specific DNA-methyltransferase (adenine-specific)